MNQRESIIMKNNCNNQGITLITLVITIILLIILAGIVINLSLGENGLFNRAKKAKNEYINEAEYEQAKLSELANNIDEINNDSNIKKGKLSQIIDATDYGKTINYSANGVSDWKVFYNDGTNVFIITTDYLENSLIPNNIGIGIGGKYGVYFKNVDNKQAIEILKNKNNWEMFSTGKGAKEAYRGTNFRYVCGKLECKKGIY